MVQILWKTVCQVVKRLNMGPLHGPFIPHLSICLRDVAIYVHTRTYINVIAALTHKSQKVETSQMSMN